MGMGFRVAAFPFYYKLERVHPFWPGVFLELFSGRSDAVLHLGPQIGRDLGQ